MRYAVNKYTNSAYEHFNLCKQNSTTPPSVPLYMIYTNNKEVWGHKTCTNRKKTSGNSLIPPRHGCMGSSSALWDQSYILLCPGEEGIRPC